MKTRLEQLIAEARAFHELRCDLPGVRVVSHLARSAEETLAAGRGLARMIVEAAIQEELSTHVAVSFEEGPAAQILLMAESFLEGKWPRPAC